MILLTGLVYAVGGFGKSQRVLSTFDCHQYLRNQLRSADR